MPPGLKGKVDMVDDAGADPRKLGEWEAALPSFRSGASTLRDPVQEQRGPNGSHPGNKQPEVGRMIWLARTARDLVGRDPDLRMPSSREGIFSGCGFSPS